MGTLGQSDTIVTPRISVIIPAYNRASLIGETIECMLRQTLAPHEVIVVDDGSSDDTVAVVRGFGARVTLIEQANAGPGAARNTGFARATGEWVQFFDSDDLATRDKLASQAQALNKSGADIAYSPWAQAWFADGKVRIGRHVYQQGPVPLAPLSAYLRSWILFIPACLIRRELLARVGCYPTSLRTGEDLELLMRLILAGARFVHAPGPVLLVRQHPEHQVSAAPELAEMRAQERLQLFATVDTLIAEAGLRPGLQDRLFWHSAAWDARCAADRIAGRQLELALMDATISRLRQLAAGARSRFGGTRLGSLFAPAKITAEQLQAIIMLGYQPVLA